MNGFIAHTSDAKLDALFSRGGIVSMLSSVSLILLALALGGLLLEYQIVATLIDKLKKRWIVLLV